MASYQTGNEKPDVIIIGGGIVGLWAAYFAAKRGLQVELLEQNILASGASGGILGALMPHQPSGWNGKKQFQLDGLLALPTLIEELENSTNINCGYRRVGRIMPIAHPEKRQQSTAWEVGAIENWPDAISWQVKDEHPAEGWASDIAPNGWNTDTLSARINPRGLNNALIAALRTNKNVKLFENTKAEPELLEQASAACPIIITAGLGSFALINPDNPKKIGKGVKGQGARLKPTNPVDPNSPIIYDNGTYVIAHADGTVAVGSTSENQFEHPTSTDEKLDEVIANSQRLCPVLNDADVIERWANVRPKAGKPDPLLGPLPNHQHCVVATGGFKITIAIAHLMAQKALAMALGEQADVPEMLLPEFRLS